MPKFAANLWFLFQDRPFLGRFKAAADCGFSAVEYHFPYAHPIPDVVDALNGAGLIQALFNFPAGDWDGGEVGIAALPGREGEFRDGVGLAVDYAKALGCTRINALAGRTPDGDRATAKHWDTFKENVAFAADACARDGIEVMMEPINTHMFPGFVLNRTAQALDVIAELERPNLFVEYDVFHAQRMEGELTGTLRAHLNKIGHIQVSSVPDRHEPDGGEVNYPYLFRLLDDLDYAGWIGCEYHPRTTTEAGLGWAAPYGIRAPRPS